MIRQLPAVFALVAVATACSRSASNADSANPAADSASAVSAVTTDRLPAGPMEGLSLLGDTLWRPAVSESARERLETALAAAEAGVGAAPNDPDSLIWLGRRQAYLGRYRAAVATFTRGIEQHPNDARFLRHRGHRFLTLRDIEPAIADFTKAAELERGRADVIEPDGAPNAAGIPLSTTQFNIWYHLGLAHFLRGDLAKALDAYDECLKVSLNPDLRVATAYWRYMTLRRLGRDADAKASIAFVNDSITLLENDGYLALLRLFNGNVDVSTVMPPTPAGEMDVANSTTAFGVGMWHLLNGRRDEAQDIWTRIVAGGQWAAFGSLAAEAELARARRQP
jgi:tetratricopeptide (TPR) repeat protein